MNRKRKSPNPAKRKRNENRKLPKGQVHRNWKEQQVGPRANGADCKCKYECFKYIYEGKRKTILKRFNSIGDKHEQDVYLDGLITANPVQRRSTYTWDSAGPSEAIK
ncbi:hypothetical protein PR048_030484 [Dryococelus australis]|uniref:Uncharacterized protein n=1 Tax=Dryococelus australis TaxID=614101 RepID=A0ABQ9G946_9NEOP|nr:hypothetical protein PR048_030484 [Dryococelus australis]